MKELSVAFVFFIFSTAVAQEKTFVREYTYKASEMDSKNSCRAIAINQLRSILLNEIGVYVESESILKTTDVSGKFAQDFVENIATISAGVTKLEVLEEKWNGEEFWMKASITIDKKNLEESLRQLVVDRQKVQELEEIKKQLINAKSEIDKLRKELTNGKKLNDQLLGQNTDVYNRKINELKAGDYLLSGNSEFASGKHKAAIASFTKAIDLGQNDAKTYYKRGTAKYLIGDNRGAIDDFSKVISIEPENIGAFYRRGDAEAEDIIKDYRSAISDYSKVIEINSTWEAPYTRRGDVKYKMGDFRGAIADYTNALDLHIKSTSVLELDASIAIFGTNDFRVGTYRSRGDAKHKLKDYYGAIEDYTMAINLYPNSSTLFFRRGLSEDSLHDYNRAISDYTKAIEIYSDYTLAYYSRGIARIGQNQKNNGCKDLYKAKELGNNDADDAIKNWCR